VARWASTLQQTCGGRLVLGIGIGGHPAEHLAYGIPFPDAPERVARLEEAVAVLRALWGGGPVSRPSPFYPLVEAHAYPVPEPPPPVLVGGETPAGARLAARVGDGWATEPDEFDDRLVTHREALAAAGRSSGATFVLVSFEGGRAGEDALRGSPWVESTDDALADWLGRGADGVVVSARTAADVDALVRAAERW
jgi:alkanesulfonate monooxygenase SsuD/methylene tetrahydromethanopterin reductase-like flavin-dependent oxidoreductase (luciferase family)